MEGFGLVLGHLIGDYVVQNDWMAANKTNPHPGGSRDWIEYCSKADARKAYRLGHAACLIHCLCYTLAVWAFSFWWMPWWGLLVCFAAHFPVDRWRLARLWMIHAAGQKAFATGVLSPWSVIVVDNTFHLAVLFVIGAAATLS